MTKIIGRNNTRNEVVKVLHDTFETLRDLTVVIPKDGGMVSVVTLGDSNDVIMNVGLDRVTVVDDVWYSSIDQPIYVTFVMKEEIEKSEHLQLVFDEGVKKGHVVLSLETLKELFPEFRIEEKMFTKFRNEYGLIEHTWYPMGLEVSLIST